MRLPGLNHRTILRRAVAPAILALTGVAGATEPLAPRIDAIIATTAASAGRALAGPVDDAGFLRRASLDFSGTIPTADETRKFLANPAPDKRAKLIDQLMTAPAFAVRMTESFHVQLMERNGDDKGWKAYLTESFRANKPWDVMAREILNPEFKTESLAGAGYFITRRLEKEGEQSTDYPGLTRDAGRLFMGVDLQCCQCHRHLTVKDYKQMDFNGLFVAFQNVKLQEPSGGAKTRWVSENVLAAKYEFVSVLNNAKGQTGPRVPFLTEIEIPQFAKEEQWLVPPDNKQPGTPKFSPLRELAQRLASSDNPYFACNIANRLWFLVMGRGLVEPLDLHHSDNPPSHPALLDLLAAEIVARRFDLNSMLRELALTETYQRSSQFPANAKDAPEELFIAARERPLAAEQLARAFLVATGEHERVANGNGWENAGDKKYSQAEFEKAFTAAFANAPREPEVAVNPTLQAALFLRNNELVHWSLQRRSGNLIDRVAAMTDPAAMADELYLSILTRPASPEEKSELAEWQTKHAANRERALGHYAWALLSSIEFFTNH